MTIVDGALSISDDGSVMISSDSHGQLFAKATSSGRTSPIGPAGQFISQPLLNTNGTRVIFLSANSNSFLSPAQLFYSRTDGSGLRQLTNVPEGVSEAILSGDGKIAYALTKNGTLLKIDTSTANATQLVAPYPTPTFLGGGTPGSLVIATYSNVPLPSAAGSPPYSAPLAGITVTVEDRPAPLLLISPTQMEFQIPWDAPTFPYPVDLGPFTSVPRDEPMGPAAVLPGAGPLFEAAFPLGVYPLASAFLFLAAYDPVSGYQPSAVHQDGLTLVTTSQPAMPGETVTMYGTGFGAVSSAQPDGVLAPTIPLSVVTPPIQLFLSFLGSGSSESVTPSFLGLAPGFVGLYQVNFEIPVDAPVSANHLLYILSLGKPPVALAELPLAVPENRLGALRFP